jgi:glycerophosphoryl diester phosphodiesterase
VGVVRLGARRGLPVLVWTVNDEASLIRLLSDARVTGIVTDHPERAVALREAA